MKQVLWMLILAAVASIVTAIENKQPSSQKTIKELGEEIRDRRNLEYSLNLPHSRVASFRSERRISNSPPHDIPQKSVSFQGRPGYGSAKRPPFQAPPYAVAMEPMVQYSQKDPLYDGNSDHLEEVITRNEIQAQPKILTAHDSPTDNTLIDPVYSSPHGGQVQHGPPYGPLLVPYYDHPEPIIEIIIKESNESLPAPVAQPLVRPRKKEPVQVFYVKYQQNPHDPEGKDIIYDAPVPAITPPTNDESDHHEGYSTVAPELLTAAPPPSTTLRAVIKPDSEDYHSNSGIRITFGTEHQSHGSYQDSLEGHEESAPHISVALPQKSSPKSQPQQSQQFQKRQQVNTRDQQPLPTQSFQQSVNYQENRHQHAQQRIQFQQNSFPQNYQQLPHANGPNNQFRSQSSQFSRPTAAVFSNPQLVQSSKPHGPPQTPRGPPPTFVVPQGPSNRPPSPNFPPQGPPNFPPQGPPNFPPQGPPNFPPPNFPSQSPPNPRPPPQFAPRPDFPTNGPPRSPFPPRPLHQGGPPQQFFNEHEYLQQNYHTITTEQLEEAQRPHGFREQHLPNKPPQNFREPPQNFREPPQNFREPPQNFREPPRKPIQAPIPISQEEYNQRYYEQVRLLQQQDQRPRPQANQPPPSIVRQPPNQLPVRPTPNNITPFKQLQTEQHLTQQINVQPQFTQPQPQNLHPQPPLSQQPQAFHQDHPSQFIPPGGELVASIPKYEQHILIPPNPQPTFQNSPNQQNIPQASQLVQGRPQTIEIQPSQQIHQQVLTENRPQLISNQQFHQQTLNDNRNQQVLSQQYHHQGNQQILVDSRNQQSSSPISNADLISAYEQNQQEIMQLQERLHLSEQEQKQLLGSQENASARPASGDQYVTGKGQLKNYQSSNNQIQDIRGRTPQQQQYIGHNTNRPPLVSSTIRPKEVSSTTRFVSSTANSITEKPGEQKKEKTKKPIEFDLPDEVPDELRQQLLSSGILENAQISVLDYDKVGDIPLESLPPEQLANFYGAGGGLQISGSAPVASVVRPNGEKVKNYKKHEDSVVGETIRSESIVDTKGKKKEVEMKVVHFDPYTVKGQQVAGTYVQDGAKQVDPVSLNDHKYNRYLPLKVNGAHFPLPDVPELKGRKVTSVVVLAPVDYDFAKTEKDGGRSERAAPNKKGINFVAGDALKRLVKTPTVENYQKWLQKEKTTSPDLQSVVLLVTGTEDGNEKNKEIFMYDITSQSVSKLSGELSSAFVDVAETNAHSKDFDHIAVSDSGIVETSVRLAPVETTTKKHKFNNHKAVYTEIDLKKQQKKAEGVKSSEQSVKSNVFDSSISRREGEDKIVNQVLINSGYSRMKLGRNLRRTE